MLGVNCKESKITKNHVNMIPPKETNKAPVTDPKEMEVYILKNSLKKKEEGEEA